MKKILLTYLIISFCLLFSQICFILFTFDKYESNFFVKKNIKVQISELNNIEKILNKTYDFYYSSGKNANKTTLSCMIINETQKNLLIEYFKDIKINNADFHVSINEAHYDSSQYKKFKILNYYTKFNKANSIGLEVDIDYSKSENIYTHRNFKLYETNTNKYILIEKQ